MVRYSIVIPNYDPLHQLTEFLSKCLISVGKNSKDYELILINNVEGFPTAVNIGLKKAKGDFLIILNNDVEIQDPEWLEKLCHKKEIRSWKMRESIIGKVPDGSCWAMHKDVYAKIGELDERFSEGYGFEDSDYWMRAKQAGIKLGDAKVKLIHHENKTFEKYHPGRFVFQQNHNKNLFKKKWRLNK